MPGACPRGLSDLLPVGNGARGETDVSLSKGQTVYVPVYSHIYGGDREHRFYLAVTLSIRNTDPTHPITVLEANYFDSEGVLSRSIWRIPSS